MGQGSLTDPSLRIRKDRAEEALKLEVLEGPSFTHNRLVRVFDQNGGRPQGRCPFAPGCGRETEETPEARGYAGVVLELEVDLPEKAVVAYGRKMFAV